MQYAAYTQTKAGNNLWSISKV